MPAIKKNTLQRVSIVAHLLCLVAWTVIFNGLSKIVNEGMADNLGILFMVLWAITSIFSFQNTGLLKFTHTKTKDLDERELAVTNKAIRFGYSVLAITVPALLYFFILARLRLHIVVPFFFLYLAHILPAVYLGWKGEKR